MKTEEEVQEWLSENMPDGPDAERPADRARQEGIQEALDWVTGISHDLEP